VLGACVVPGACVAGFCVVVAGAFVVVGASVLPHAASINATPATKNNDKNFVNFFIFSPFF
jgi:hypothetical protein